MREERMEKIKENVRKLDWDKCRLIEGFIEGFNSLHFIN